MLLVVLVMGDGGLTFQRVGPVAEWYFSLFTSISVPSEMGVSGGVLRSSIGEIYCSQLAVRREDFVVQCLPRSLVSTPPVGVRGAAPSLRERAGGEAAFHFLATKVQKIFETNERNRRLGRARRP